MRFSKWTAASAFKKSRIKSRTKLAMSLEDTATARAKNALVHLTGQRARKAALLPQPPPRQQLRQFTPHQSGTNVGAVAQIGTNTRRASARAARFAAPPPRPVPVATPRELVSPLASSRPFTYATSANARAACSAASSGGLIKIGSPRDSLTALWRYGNGSTVSHPHRRKNQRGDADPCPKGQCAAPRRWQNRGSQKGW